MNDHRLEAVQDDPVRRAQALRALAAFLGCLRPGWDPPGVLTALQAASVDHGLAELATAAVRAAQEPSNRGPGVIPLPGAHWRPPQPVVPPGRQPPPVAPFVADLAWRRAHLDPDTTQRGLAACRAAIKQERTT